MLDLLPLLFSLLFELRKFGVLGLQSDHILLALLQLGVLEVAQVLLVALQDALEERLFLVRFGQHLLARIPADWVLSLRGNTAGEGLGAGRLWAPLLAKFVGAVAEHDALVVTDTSLGHRVKRADSSGGNGANRAYVLVRH